jgi:hypothetical protein
MVVIPDNCNRLALGEKTVLLQETRFWTETLDVNQNSTPTDCAYIRKGIGKALTLRVFGKVRVLSASAGKLLSRGSRPAVQIASDNQWFTHDCGKPKKKRKDQKND